MEYLLGVVVSLIVQTIKKYGEIDSLLTHLVLLVTSLLMAVLYVILSQNDALWQSFIQLLVVASAFHNLILRKFEEPHVTDRPLVKTT